MSEWKEYKLGDIANIQTGPFGSQLHKSDYKPMGIPCIMPCNISLNLDICCDNIAYISEEDADRLCKHKTQTGDIIYSRRGDIEKCAYISEKESGWVCGTGCLKIRIDSEKAIPKFVAYQLSTPLLKSWIVGSAVGTTMLNLNTSILSVCPISIPSLPTQQKIANILSSLDDKIEVNRRINEQLEELAQALFKSWFVDFEPFKDGEFVESELGMIPEGWKVGKAEEFYKITIGKTPPRKEQEWFTKSSEDVKWVSISDMGNCGTYVADSSEYLTNDAIQRFNIGVVSENTILLSFKLTIGRVAIAMCDLTTNEAIARFSLINETLREYTYLMLKQYNYANLGSTSSIATAVNSKIIKQMRILMPKNEVIFEFSKLMKPVFENIKKNQQEITHLTNLRDTLLPKLMSGEIDV